MSFTNREVPHEEPFLKNYKSRKGVEMMTKDETYRELIEIRQKQSRADTPLKNSFSGSFRK